MKNSYSIRTTAEKMIQIINHKGWALVDYKPVSANPADAYLLRVVVRRQADLPDSWCKAPFTGYTFNGADGCEGFAGGHYDLTILDAAEWLTAI